MACAVALTLIDSRARDRRITEAWDELRTMAVSPGAPASQLRVAMSVVKAARSFPPTDDAFEQLPELAPQVAAAAATQLQKEAPGWDEPPLPHCLTAYADAAIQNLQAWGHPGASLLAAGTTMLLLELGWRLPFFWAGAAAIKHGEKFTEDGWLGGEEAEALRAAFRALRVLAWHECPPCGAIA